jgi:hypothetical protein
MTAQGSAHDVAAWLLAQVESALAECDREPLNRAYVAAGQIAWDDCCGMLVVAPERVFRSSTFPVQETNEELCWGGYLTVDLLVLLVRCIPTVDDRGRAPSAAALDAAYTGIIEDAAVVFNAVISAMPNREWMRATPTQTFVGAEGGCIGVETRLTLGIPQNEWALCCVETVPYTPGSPVCTVPASSVTFTPCEGLEADNVQDALCELAEAIPGPAPVITGPVSFAVNGGTIGGSQPTFSGPPMFTGQVMTIGDLVRFEIQVEFDNITSFGTGQYFVDLPFVPSHPVMLREGCLHDFSTGRQYQIAGHAAAGNATLTLWFTSSNGHDEVFDHNSPVNLAVQDNFHIAGSYFRS